MKLGRKRAVISTASTLLAAVTMACELFGRSSLVAAQPALSVIASADAAIDPCARLTSLNLDQIEIELAKTQPAQAAVEGAKLPGMTGNPGEGATVRGLPAFCRVAGRIHSQPGSDIRFEV
jgi:hypothetical protein